MKEEKIFSKIYMKNVFKFLILSIGISIILSFVFGGFKFSLIKISDFFFMTGALIAILGGIVLAGTWIHIKKVLRDTPKDQEVDAKSLAPRQFSYACLIIGMIHIILSAFTAVVPLLFL